MLLAVADHRIGARVGLLARGVHDLLQEQVTQMVHPQDHVDRLAIEIEEEALGIVLGRQRAPS